MHAVMYLHSSFKKGFVSLEDFLSKSKNILCNQWLNAQRK